METGLITPSPELRRTPTFAHSLLAIVGTAGLICLGFGVYKVKVEVLLLIATALVGALARWLGLSWKEMQGGMLQSIHKGMPALLIVIVVGALVGSWLAAGTIPMITYYGLGLISPRLYLVTAAVSAVTLSQHFWGLFAGGGPCGITRKPFPRTGSRDAFPGSCQGTQTMPNFLRSPITASEIMPERR